MGYRDGHNATRGIMSALAFIKKPKSLYIR